MSTSENDGQGVKFRAGYLGEVVDNADPERVGRVRVRVPGVVEPASGWAWPIGASGGGFDRRGAYWPPAKGAAVLVFFLGGDVERPVFFPGPWGFPAGVPETPGPVGGYTTPGADGVAPPREQIAPADAPRIKAVETDHFVVVVDEREGRALLRVEAKKSGDHLLFDAVNHTADLKTSNVLTIRSDTAINLDAPKITFGGRVLVLNDQPIK